MDFEEKFRNDQKRKVLLQQLIDAYDLALISHQLDENQNIIAVYDKYSNIKINKLIRELRDYEYQKFNIKGGVYPFPLVMNGKLYEQVVKVDKVFDIETENVEFLQNELKKALEREDFEKCEELKKKIDNLRK